MFDLGLGSFLAMVRESWGRVPAQILMLVIYLAIFAVCLPLIWANLLKPAYGVAIVIMDWVAKGDFILRTPISGWLEWVRQGIAAIFAGGLSILSATAAVIIGRLVRAILETFRSADFKRELAQRKADARQQKVE